MLASKSTLLLSVDDLVACSECPLVEQIWIYGNSYESYLVAIVVPIERELKSWASSAGISGSVEEICKNPKVPSGECIC